MRITNLRPNGKFQINTGPPLAVIAVFLIVYGIIQGCQSSTPIENISIPPFVFERTGEEFLISSLDELNSISDWAQSTAPEAIPPREGKLVLSQTASDTVYVYGQVISGGYGAVVTERHSYPKGLLLITVRKSYGKGDGHVVTDTKRYISFDNFINDEPQQSSITEVYGLSADTIVTRVLRNEILETFTFRLPVITRTVNPADGSVRVTSRYGFNGAIVSEIRDGNDALIQLRTSNGLSNGALVTRTDFPDSTWRSTLTLGQSDGTVFREITSGP